MAKLNKYWGLVAVGAATAAAAGALAAIIMKKKPHQDLENLDDDFEEDDDILEEEKNESEEPQEDFVSWEEPEAESEEPVTTEDAEEETAEPSEETAPAEEAALTEEPAPEAVVEQEPAKAEQEAPEENGEAGAEPETEAFSKIKIGKNTMYEKLDKLRAILPNKYENDENTGMVNIAEYWLQDADADYIYVDAYYYRRENADAEAFEDNQVGRFKYAEVNGEYAIVGDFEPMEVCWLTIE